MSTYRPRPGHLALAHLFSLLVDGANATEIQEETGLQCTTIYPYINALRSKGVCYIAGWNEDTGGRISLAVHKIGRGKKDVPKPLPRRLSREMVNQRQRERYRRERDAKRLGLLTRAPSYVTA